MSQTIPVKLYLRITTIPLEQLKIQINSYVIANKLIIDREFIDYVDTKPNFYLMMALIQPNEIILTTNFEIISEDGTELLKSLLLIKQKNVYLHTLNFGLLDPNRIVPIIESIYTILRKNTSWIRDAIPCENESSMITTISRGRSPFGYKNLGKGTPLEPVESQQLILTKIFKMHNEGLNYTHIAQKLNDSGDNMRMNDNKKSAPKKIIFFNAEGIKRILFDHGLIKANYKRKPVLAEEYSISSVTSTSITKSLTLLKIPADEVSTIDAPLSIDNTDSNAETTIFPIHNDCGID